MFHVIFPYCFKIVNMLCFICEWMNNLYIFLQVIEIMCVLARLQYIRADCVPSFEGSVSPPSEALGLSQLPTLPAVKYLILSQVPIPLQRGLESGPLSPRQWRVESGPHPPSSEVLFDIIELVTWYQFNFCPSPNLSTIFVLRTYIITNEHSMHLPKLHLYTI